VLIAIAEEEVAATKKMLDDTAGMRGQNRLTALKIEALCDEIAHYCDLGMRLINHPHDHAGGTVRELPPPRAVEGF
jgi:hypothetical protein